MTQTAYAWSFINDTQQRECAIIVFDGHVVQQDDAPGIHKVWHRPRQFAAAALKDAQLLTNMLTTHRGFRLTRDVTGVPVPVDSGLFTDSARYQEDAKRLAALTATAFAGAVR